MSWLRSVRVADALTLQAFPVLGLLYAGRHRLADDPFPAIVLLVSLSALYAHIFALNDWANVHEDWNHPDKSPDVFLRYMPPRAMGTLILVLGLIAFGGFSLLPARTWPYAMVLFAASLLYSHPRVAWKRVPLVSSALHATCGTAHCLVGAALYGPVDAGSLLLAMWCGLIFAAGHLVQEVQDHDADRVSGIVTNAVRFGKRRVFAAAFVAFTVSFLYLVGLATARVIPSRLWLVALLYPIVPYLFFRGLRSGITPDAVRHLRRRYRIVFAIVAVVLAAGVWQG